MGRRKPGALFDDEQPSGEQSPDESTLPITENTTEQAAEADASAPSLVSDPLPSDPLPTIDSPSPKKKKRRVQADGDMTLREHVRERAGQTQFERIDLYECIIRGKKRVGKKLIDYTWPVSMIMEAAERLDEMAIDKTPTAQPQVSKRSRLLVGHAGMVPGRYQGGDSVTGPVTKLPAITPTNG